MCTSQIYPHLKEIKANLLLRPSVGWQRKRPHGSFELLLCGNGAAAIAAGHRSDLNVELLGLFVIKV